MCMVILHGTTWIMKKIENKKKVILVSGASKGIGLEVCKQLIEEGFRVIGIARSKTTSFQHESFTYLSLDIQDRNLFHKVKQITKNLSIYGLICCAGICRSGCIEKIKAFDFWKNYEINVIGNYNLIQCFISEIEVNEGFVVSITSDVGSFCIPDRVGYASSRKAQNIMVQCMQQSYPSIHFYSVALGITKSDLYYSKYESVKEQKEAEKKQIKLYPLRRLGEYLDVKSLIHYLVGTQPNIASVIFLNGGAKLI